MGYHYVPQEYLRGFAHSSCPNALWQFDKATQTFSAEPAAISNIAQQRAFYDVETERLLNEQVEIPGNRVLRKLRFGERVLSDEDRVALSVYIATMVKRVPRSRAKATEMAPQVLVKVTTELRNQIRAIAADGRISPETAAKQLVDTDAAEATLLERIPDNVREQIRSPWPTEQIIDLVYGMHWRFVCAEAGQFFVTTDNPVFFFECYGLGKQDSELTFPVSSDLAIFGSWHPVKKSGLIVRRSQFVKEACRRLISDATRFIYSGSKAEWISKIAAKNDPHLSRIQWNDYYGAHGNPR